MPTSELCLTKTFFDLGSRLPASALTLHRRYAGHLERVRSYGVHSLLLLRETSEDGWPLAVWVGEMVLRSNAAKPWVDLLGASHATPLRVVVRGRFALHVHARRLTIDVESPLDLWVGSCDDQEVDLREVTLPCLTTRPELSP